MSKASPFRLHGFLRRVGRWRRRALIAEKTVCEMAESNASLRNALLDMEIIAREQSAEIEKHEMTIMGLRAELWAALQRPVLVYEDVA